MNFLDWQKDNQAFIALAGYRGDEYNMTGSGEPERVHTHMISAEFFAILGLTPVVGQNFRAEEDLPGAGPVVILGDELWKRRFASAPDIIGKNITLDGKSYTVLGVARQRLPMMAPSDVYIPIGQWNDTTFRDRHISMGRRVVGRLKPGLTMQQASAEMDRIAANQAAAYPDSNKGNGITLIPLKADVVGDVTAILLVLLALILLVGAGLMIRSLLALWHINPGFDSKNALTFSVSVTSKPGATPDQLRARYREAVRQFARVPGLEKPSMLAGSLPMSGDSELPFWLEGQPKPANQGDMPFALSYMVTADYQNAMGIPLLRGRFFTEQDNEHAPAVVVIDANFAKTHFPRKTRSVNICTSA